MARRSTPAGWRPRAGLAERMVELFADRDGGGFFYSGADGEALVARTRDLEDHPTPAGNSQAAHVLLRLAGLTGDAALEERAAGALALVRGEMARFPQAFGTALIALDDLLAERREIAVVGPADDARTAELVGAARAGAAPADALAAGDPADPAAAEAAPLLRRPAAGGRGPAAYVCVGFACRAPVTSPEELTADPGGVTPRPQSVKDAQRRGSNVPARRGGGHVTARRAREGALALTLTAAVGVAGDRRRGDGRQADGDRHRSSAT